MPVSHSPKFRLGQTVATPAALRLLERVGVSPASLLKKHSSLDQGDLCDDDHQANVDAVVDGGRVFSSFAVDETGAKVWIITEADRSVTTVLTPEDY